ncbi:MAG: hypothetical protein LPK46_12475 [Bacteroidota bacterium]|nr:hypothetical protein [Bacteroidota bacterium]MDX5506943.1 hypothetical protein [Bacteroidota bacterium]
MISKPIFRPFVVLFFILLGSLSPFRSHGQASIKNGPVSISIGEVLSTFPIPRDENFVKILGIDGDYAFYQTRRFPAFAPEGRNDNIYFQTIEKRNWKTGELIYAATIDETKYRGGLLELHDCFLSQGEVFMLFDVFQKNTDSRILVARKLDPNGKFQAFKPITKVFTPKSQYGEFMTQWDEKKGELLVFTKGDSKDHEKTRLSFEGFNRALEETFSHEIIVPSYEEDHFILVEKIFEDAVHFIDVFPLDDDKYSVQYRALGRDGTIKEASIGFPARIHSLWITRDGSSNYVEGLSSAKDENYFAGYFKIAVDLNEGRSRIVKIQGFNDEFTEKIADHRSIMRVTSKSLFGPKRSSRYRPVWENSMEDGERLLVLSKKIVIYTQGAIAPFDHYVEDLIVVKMDSVGNFEWYKHIPMRFNPAVEDQARTLMTPANGGVAFFFPNDSKNLKAWQDSKTRADYGSGEHSTLVYVNSGGKVNYAEMDHETNADEMGYSFLGSQATMTPLEEGGSTYLVIAKDENKRGEFIFTTVTLEVKKE